MFIKPEITWKIYIKTCNNYHKYFLGYKTAQNKNHFLPLPYKFEDEWQSVLGIKFTLTVLDALQWQ